MNAARLGGACRRGLVPLAVATLLSPAHADAVALAEVPVPPDASTRTVATDIVRDGRRTSIVSLESDAAVEDVLGFYRRSWTASADDPGHIEERLGEWAIVSRIEGDSLVVVQLRDGPSGSEGFLSAMALDATPTAAFPPPPMPPGGELLSITSARDGASVATTFVVASTARPGEVAAFYRDRLVRDGWTLVSDRTHAGSSVLLLDRGGARVEIVATRLDGRSVVVFNEVRLDV